MGRLRQRIDEGRASLWDRLRYCWMWIGFRFQVIGAVLGWRRMEFGFDIPRATPLDGATLDRHVSCVSELFPDADSRALRALLLLNRFPAENLLADFLGEVGLPRLYAYLNYRYLEEHDEDELADEGIVKVTTLHFDPPA